MVTLLAAAAHPADALHAHPAVAMYRSLSARHTVASLDGAQASKKLPQAGTWQVLVSTLQEPKWHGANATDWAWRSQAISLVRRQSDVGTAPSRRLPYIHLARRKHVSSRH